MSPLMLVHVVTGTIAVLAGATALAAPKGAPVHRFAGTMFLVFMLMTSLAGAVIALLKPEMITAIAGIFTCYLVLTSWLSASTQTHAPGLGELTLMVAGGAIAAAGVYFGLEALGAPDGLKDGYSAEPYFFFAGLALFAAALDASLILRRRLGENQRIARHLWRMCLALFIAVGSLFTGPGATAFPESIQGSPLLSLPELLVLALMLIWLVRVLLLKWATRDAA